MKSLITVIALAVMATPAVARPQLLDFEDVTTTAQADINGPYHHIGFWDDLAVIDGSRLITQPNGYTRTRVSGNYVAFGTSSVSSFIADDTAPFSLLDGWFGAAWRNDVTLEITGSLAGTVIYDRILTVNADAAQFVLLGFVGVDRVTFASSGGVANSAIPNYFGGPTFTMDDVHVATVPEPAVWSMAITGFAGMGLTMRRRRLRRSAPGEAGLLATA